MAKDDPTALVPERFLGFAFCVGDLLIELDGDLKILHVDGAAHEIAGAEGDRLLGKGLSDLLMTADVNLVETALKSLSGANRRGPFSIRLKIKDRPPRSMVLFLYKLPGSATHYYIVFLRPYRLGAPPAEEGQIEPSLISDEKRQEGFFDRLQNLMAGDVEGDLVVTVVEVPEGSKLSASQRQMIEASLKAMAIDGESATRLAEDRYAVLHEKSLGAGNAAAMIGREVAMIAGQQMTVASLEGEAARLGDENGLRALIHGLKQFADHVGGYKAEDFARNCHELIEHSAERVRVFRKMVAEESFSLVYQPIVDLRSEAIHHYEALTRFPTDGEGVSPYDTIRFAEDVGLIDQFDRAVLQRSIRVIRSGLERKQRIALAVNLSGCSLSRRGFLDELIGTLAEARDISHLLSLEVTESSLISDLAALGEVLKDIKKQGFTVYLDDFGAGAAGFQYLRELKPGALKIDGSYIRDALVNREDRAFLRSMVSLCQELEIKTVAEWVETKHHVGLLTGIGVDYGQGYFFGRPRLIGN